MREPSLKSNTWVPFATRLKGGSWVSGDYAHGEVWFRVMQRVRLKDDDTSLRLVRRCQ